jgi:diguanylate cyclase (GGDEF)-like protein
MTRAGALLWGTGGLLAISAIALPHPEKVGGSGVLAVGSFACAMALGHILLGKRLPGPGLRAAPPIGTIAITLLVWFGNGTTLSAAFAMLYVWIGLYVAYFLRRIDVYFNVGLIAALHGVAVWIQEGVLTPAWHLSTGTVVVGSLMVSALVGRLRGLVQTDGLTSLANRRGFDEALRLEILRAGRDGVPLSVAVIDLDRFKDLNDRFGHGFGDAVLRRVAGAWREQLRATDTLSRYGGDEFLLLLPGAGREDAERVVERLRRATPLGVTVSAGIACWDEGETPETFKRRADLAVYEAKQRGRNRAVTAPAPEPVGSGGASVVA